MDKQQDWWNRTSAVDDGIDRDDSWLDDFDFIDEGPKDRIGNIWNTYGSWSSARSTKTNDATKKAIRLASAQRVVQGFVDTFATGDKPYRVTFSLAVKTAGTDFKARQVVVSHKPLLDPTLDASEANTILTAMAVHEASHVRYGRKTAAAIQNHPDQRAARLSNILDDVRIERRFSEDYPGYAEVFAPAIAYVAGGTHALADMADELSRVSAMVRYTDHITFAADELVERDWWLDWADRGSRNDSPAHHVAAVDEALAHLQSVAQPKPPIQPGKGTGTGSSSQDKGDERSGSKPSDEQRDGSPDAGSGSGDASEGDESQGEGDDETTPSQPGKGYSPEAEPVDLSDCFADGIDERAVENGADQQMNADQAQVLVEQAASLVEVDEHTTGEVVYGAQGIARSRKGLDAPVGASAIRAAFARSRTGSFAKQAGLSSGRIDNRSLHRIASNDYRLFNRRQAQSEGRYRVWLLVDCSGSMGGQPIEQATQVASTLAAAVRQMPNIALEVWGWTSPFRFGYQTSYSNVNADFGAVRVYAEGESIANLGYLPRVPMGGTPDYPTLKWAAKAIQKAARPGEQPVIIIASDGAGGLASDAGTTLVDETRRSGVEVVSVAFGYGLDAIQAKVYGANGYIPWAGSIAATAGPLGRLIARVAAGKGAR